MKIHILEVLHRQNNAFTHTEHYELTDSQYKQVSTLLESYKKENSKCKETTYYSGLERSCMVEGTHSNHKTVRFEKTLNSHGVPIKEQVVTIEWSQKDL